MSNDPTAAQPREFAPRWSPRKQSEMAPLEALLGVWRGRGFTEAWDYVLTAEKMIAAERAWYEKLGAKARKRTKPPLRIRIAYRLLKLRPS